MSRRHTFFDHCLMNLDTAVRSVMPGVISSRVDTPGAELPEAELTDSERRHAAGLMRVNHTGEVCAQALYAGQASTARLGEVRAQMEEAAAEERDHLAWCETRLRALHSRPSLLNPLFYGMSFTLGATAGALGDRWSLGFVAATEDQVSQHLAAHLQRLPEQDRRSRAVVARMLEDEQRHAEHARDAGGLPFPEPVRQGMTLMSKVMTETTYRL
ncbi:MAG: 2-polyprenyl-3-methyl-6-methoxy-1,4-benzoquinone monooxygenase [Natronospirillum sp.]|uniref:2-polyprenyl-3-methyl-6-methoxy-1,4-benzoquinone monooxygenase n=1 Tax=Natronospirillum sp. TaxID=2812955 RepID=UPI0026015AA5|nr:2-polyprenyl-3-methyl-6-methoxy-1,4-benzoquinone monooxygenase [Natronospirillum sp.]MCH8551942.1 2-polyprenyl-3-methyl-6-methoxy-1,4-benzoquinone monooxygenase [Natronospirillum sp.]